MTEYIPQSSASDRYEAARKIADRIQEKIDTLQHVTESDAQHAVHAIRALISPPGVGESDEQIAERVAYGYLEEHSMSAVMQLAALAGHIERIALACVRAGIQSAHETWEPEVALRPSQEQMLRWLGLEHDEHADGSLHVHEQTIWREEI